MAKKSVLLYSDMLDIIDEMSDHEAAEIIRAIRAYLKGEEYQFEDRITKLAFIPILNLFEKDREKYIAAAARKTEAVNRRWQNYRESKGETPTPPVAKPKAEPKVSSAHHANYEWIEPQFKEIFAEWLEYKKREKKGTFKIESTVKTCYKQLLQYSNGNPQIAKEIVTQCIASGYMGLVPLKNNQANGLNNTQYERHLQGQQQLSSDLAEYYRRKREQELAQSNGTGEGGFVPPPLFDRE